VTKITKASRKGKTEQAPKVATSAMKTKKTIETRTPYVILNEVKNLSLQDCPQIGIDY